MTPLEYAKEITVVLPELGKMTGHSTLGLYATFIYQFLRYRITLDEFSASHTYEMSARKMSEYLTVRRRNRLTRKYFNAHASKEDLDILDNKRMFNTWFRDFIRRNWLDMADCSVQDVRDFMARESVFLAKDTLGTQGDHITLCHSRDLDPDAFFRENHGKSILLEAFIRQHPAMAAVNPTSVNTVRFVTACLNGNVMLVGAGLRCGGKDAYVDNFHKGGIAYPLDVASGVVTGMGQDLMGRGGVIRHPSTGHVMPGFQIPFWDQVVQAVTKAARMLPQVGYVGWDVAITEAGPEFIEGNNCSQVDLIQLGGRGVYRPLLDFARKNA